LLPSRQPAFPPHAIVHIFGKINPSARELHRVVDRVGVAVIRVDWTSQPSLKLRRASNGLNGAAAWDKLAIQ
jgi:hypothetical protein